LAAGGTPAFAGCADLFDPGFDSGAPSAPALFLTGAPTGTPVSEPGFAGASLVDLLAAGFAATVEAEAVEFESGVGSGFFAGSCGLGGTDFPASFLSSFFGGAACVASGAGSSAEGPTRTLPDCGSEARASGAQSATATTAE
jgi:hypothetical protein